MNNSNWSGTFDIKTYSDLKKYPLAVIKKALQRFLYEKEYQVRYREMLKKARQQFKSGQSIDNKGL